MAMLRKRLDAIEQVVAFATAIFIGRQVALHF